MGVIVDLGIPIFLILLGFVVGRYLERRHFRNIRERERKFGSKPAVTASKWADGRAVMATNLAMGSVVVSVDHYKRLLTGFRMLFGGELKSYSPLIERGRREAILRMKESEPDADLYLNCRLETATISNGAGKATGTVEIVAYCTAVTFAS